MPQLELSQLNIVLAVTGAFLILYGIVSSKIKYSWYLGEALPATLIGIILGPTASKFVDSASWGEPGAQNEITYVSLVPQRRQETQVDGSLGSQQSRHRNPARHCGLPAPGQVPARSLERTHLGGNAALDHHVAFHLTLHLRPPSKAHMGMLL